MSHALDLLDIEMLISKVKENRAIYDASDKNHSNRHVISSLWRKIGDDLGSPTDLIKDKWHQLRSNYRRVKRIERNKFYESGVKAKSKWPYYRMMSFLDEYSETRETSDNVKLEGSHQPSSLCDEMNYDVETSPLEEEIATAVENTESSSCTEQPEIGMLTTMKTGFKRRKEAADDVDFHYFMEPKKMNLSWPDENDADRMFLLSLLPSVKQLTPVDNMDFRVCVQKFLQNKLYPSATGYKNRLEPTPPRNIRHQDSR